MWSQFSSLPVRSSWLLGRIYETWTKQAACKTLKTIRKVGNISHLQFLWFFQFIRDPSEGEVPHFSDFPTVNAISVFKALARQFRNPLGFWCQILLWHKEELMAAITLPAAASMFLKYKPLDFLRITEFLLARKQLINKDRGLGSGLIFPITETLFAIHFISNLY